MAKTNDNLKAAFAGESQANRKYLAFAKKADEEGFPQIAKLFRAAAEAETVHAHAHLRVLGVKSTAENLNKAVSGETFEFTKMYPQFIEEAKEEDNKQALIASTTQTRLNKYTRSFTRKQSKPLKTNKTCRKKTFSFAQYAETLLKAKRPTDAQFAVCQKKSS